MKDSIIRIGVAADHAGFELKEYLVKSLKNEGCEIIDFGDLELKQEDDYPDYVIPLALAIGNGAIHRGIAVCGSGVGACIAANKVANVRACLIHEKFSAIQGVEDDDMNMICLGGRVVGHALGWELVSIFLAAKFSGAERHVRRLAKIAELEKSQKLTSSIKISPLAGKSAPTDILVNIPKLVSAYYTGIPDISVPGQQVSFGTSGHRGSSFDNSFNESHILAITQAICIYRKAKKIDGPLFLGFDTHALSAPAFASSIEVLAANGVEVMIAAGDEYTPTPVISHAIIKYNIGRKKGFADGIVITPSHNPPDNGGFKYNPANGGPAGTDITNWIESKANEILKNNLQDVKRISFDKASKVKTTHRHDYLNNYVKDIVNIIDMDMIRHSKITMGVDPLGGAGVHYWEPIADRYNLDLTVVNKTVDPTFGFMTVDWDGKIRMDSFSLYAMQGLIKMKDRFDISFACDTDHDRHGIVTKSNGLLNPNHYLSVAIAYLLDHRPGWQKTASIGKTVVTTRLIDKIITKSGRKLYDVPVGFKWFSEGLLNSSLCFGGEESAGATFSRLDGTAWTTDKDGFVPALLSAEITAKMNKDPGEIYKELTKEYGEPVYDRIEANATTEQREKIKNLSASQVKHKDLAGEKITGILTNAPANNAPIGGVKVITENGWFAARPSGTEDIYKIYAESFLGKGHLKKIIEQAQDIVNTAIKTKGRAA